MRAAEVCSLFVYRYPCKFTKQLSQRRQPRQAHERVEAVVAPLAQLVEAVVAPLAQLLAQAPTLEPLVFLGGGFARLDRGLPACDLCLLYTSPSPRDS